MSDNLVRQPQGALVGQNDVPEWMRGQEVDKSNLEPDDIRMPRLAIAQAMSPQMTPGDSQYMEELKLYDLFNDLTQTIYGKSPILFVPIVRLVQRIEFGADGKTIIDRDVPYGDPRAEWTRDPNDPTGKGIRPIATKFVNFISFLVRPEEAPEPVAISIRLTNKFARKTAERLTGWIELKKQVKRVPTYGGLYSVIVKPEKNDKGTFGVFHFSQVGLLSDRDVFESAKIFNDSLAGKNVVIEAEAAHPADEDAGDTDFDPERMERESQEAAASRE